MKLFFNNYMKINKFFFLIIYQLNYLYIDNNKYNTIKYKINNKYTIISRKKK